MGNQLLIIESNTTGTGLLSLSISQTLGLEPIFLTKNPRRYPGLEQIGCPVFVCDTNSLDALRTCISTRANFNALCGITTTSEFYLETVAQLAAVYHLPGNPSQAIKICRDKSLTRQRLEAEGVMQPRFAIVRHAQEIDMALASFAPPYVVKPADDTGSNEVCFCQTREQASDHALRILAMRENVRGQRTAGIALIEQFLDAPEFSVEMFTWQGETTCIGITEKSLIGFPYFVEYNHIFPASVPSAICLEMQKTVYRAIRAVGLTCGATHTEVKLTEQGCAVIEINARLAGGMIPELVRYATGINLVEQQLKSAINTPPDLGRRANKYAGICFLVSSKEGVLDKIEGIEDVYTIPGVKQAVITSAKGKHVVPPRSAYDRLGYIIVCADTYEEVRVRLEEARRKCRICLLSQSAVNAVHEEGNF